MGHLQERTDQENTLPRLTASPAIYMALLWTSWLYIQAQINHITLSCAMHLILPGCHNVSDAYKSGLVPPASNLCAA